MSKNRRISFFEIVTSKNAKNHHPNPRCNTSLLLFRCYHPALPDWSGKIAIEQEVSDGNAL